MFTDYDDYMNSLFRSYKSRNKSFSLLTAWKSSALFIQRVYRGWTLRKQLKDKLHEMLRETGNAHLIMSYREDLEKSSMIRIKNALRRWIRRKQQQKLEHKSAIIIQSFFRGRRTRNTAFLRAIQLHKYPRIYFLRDQGRIIVQLLQKIRPMFPQLGFTSIRDLVLKCQNICTIRYKEPDQVGHSILPLIQLVRPHLGAIVRENKYLLSEKEAVPEKAQFGQKELPVKKIVNPKWNGIKVASYYPDYVHYKKWLNLFKPRNGHHPVRQIVQAGEKLRMKDDGMPMDRYGDLCIFEPPDVPTEPPTVISMDSLENSPLKRIVFKKKADQSKEEQKQEDQSAVHSSFDQSPRAEPQSILRKFSRSSTMRESRPKRLDLQVIDSKVTTPRSRAHNESKAHSQSRSPRSKKIRLKEEPETIEQNPLKTQLLVTLFFAVFDYNREHPDAPVLLYTHVQLQRAMAATKIQTMWRNWKKRSNIEISVSRCIITRRAILVIQHWWKSLRMERRLRALADIRHHVNNICSTTLYLEQRIYLNLVQLSELRKRGASFQEQSFVFGIANYQVAIRILCQHSRYDVNSLPRWFDPTTMPVLGSYTAMDAEASAAHQDIMALIHMNENDCELLNFSSIMEHSEASLDYIPKLKFVKIETKSVEEARRRATAIALLTYSFRNMNYVKLFDTEHMANPFFITTLQVLWKQLGYTNPAERVQLNNTDFQPHNGIVILGNDKNLQYLQSSNGTEQKPANVKKYAKTEEDQQQFVKIHQEEASLLQMSDNVSVSLFLKTPPETSRTGGVREVSISRREGIRMRLLKTEAGSSDHGAANLASTVPDTEPYSHKQKLENIQSGAHLKVADELLINQISEHFQDARSVYIDSKGAKEKSPERDTFSLEGVGTSPRPRISQNIQELREQAKKRYLSQTQPSTASSGLEKKSWHMKVVEAKKSNLLQQTVKQRDRNKQIMKEQNKTDQENKKRYVLQERLVREVMKQEQQKEKEEMETAFRTLNQEEKNLVKSLLSQQAKDQHIDILERKKLVEQNLSSKRVKDNKRMFAKCFAQQHNMIIKQYRVAQARRIKEEQMVENKVKRRNLEKKLRGTSRVAIKMRNKTPIPQEDDDQFSSNFDASGIRMAAHKKSKSLITYTQPLKKHQNTDFSSNIKSGEIDGSANFLPPLPMSARGIGAVGMPKSISESRKLKSRPDHAVRGSEKNFKSMALSQTKAHRVGSGGSYQTHDFRYATSNVNSMMDFGGNFGQGGAFSSAGDIAPQTKTAYTQVLGKKGFLSDISPWKRENLQNMMGGGFGGGLVPSKFNVSVSYSDKKPNVGKPVRHSDKASVVFGKYVKPEK